MLEFDKTEQMPIVVIPEINSSRCTLLKKPKTILRPPPIDPHTRLKWGLALLGKEKASEYLAWLQSRFGAESHKIS